MTSQKLPWMIASALAGALVALAARGPTASAADKPVGCQQWETALFTEILDPGKPVQEYGKPLVTRGPAGGWEPFAFGVGGQLTYRRCAK
jgi:hypothetical protein